MNLPLLLNQLKQEQQRHLLWLAGSQTWVSEQLEQQLNLVDDGNLTIIHFSDKAPSQTNQDEEKASGHIAFARRHDARTKQYKRYLGQETDIIVFDAFAGFNPDAFGALTGTLKVGGVLILVTPSPEDWPSFTDPELNRVTVLPYTADTLNHGYLGRLTDILLHYIGQPTPGVTGWFESAENDLACPSPAHVELEPLPAQSVGSEEQTQLVASITERYTAAIKQTLNASGTPPKLATVITADRGRGKTTALAMATAQLVMCQTSSEQCRQSLFTVLITCPLADSTKVFFRHLSELLRRHCQISDHSGEQLSGEHPTGQGWLVKFVAPDHLSLDLPNADLILIDEAAAIPVTLLGPVLRHYSCCVLATTIHGYEGTGRSFEYKLKPALHHYFSDIDYNTLRQPIRWTKDDKLEPIVNRLLALDFDLPVVANHFSPNQLSYRKLAKMTLWQDRQLTESVFGLLVFAHYRTSPNDFRMLLDAPNIEVWVAEYQGQVVAAVMVATEGRIDNQLAEQIWQGRRRPRGHLFPQSLLNHGGFKDAGKATYGRIVRIAVHPELQSQGIGSKFIDVIKNGLTLDGYDYLCTSFGITDSLLQFWLHNGFFPARLGVNPEATTGELSMLMWQPLNHSAKGLFDAVSQRFYRALPIERQVLTSRQNGHIIAVLNRLQDTSTLLLDIESQELSSEGLSSQDHLDLLALTQHYRLPEHCLLAINQLLQVTNTLPEDVVSEWLRGQSERLTVQKKYQIHSDKQWVQAIRQAVEDRLKKFAGEF